jgi:hypothetical protein
MRRRRAAGGHLQYVPSDTTGVRHNHDSRGCLHDAARPATRRRPIAGFDGRTAAGGRNGIAVLSRPPQCRSLDGRLDAVVPYYCGQWGRVVFEGSGAAIMTTAFTSAECDELEQALDTAWAIFLRSRQRGADDLDTARAALVRAILDGFESGERNSRRLAIAAVANVEHYEAQILRQRRAPAA